MLQSSPSWSRRFRPSPGWRRSAMNSPSSSTPATCERDGFTPRIRSVLDEVDPLLFDFDGAGVATASNYRSENAYVALNAFLEARKHNVDTLRAVAESDFRRIGHYEGDDPITLAAVVAGMLDHDRDHVDRLRSMLSNAGG